MKYIYSFFIACTIGVSAWAQSGVGYDPESPADPSVPAEQYTLTMEAAPRYGGSVNESTVTAEAGTEVYCQASERVGYTFRRWMVGDSLVSTNSSFYYVMPAENVVLTAYFDYTGYNPENPSDPFGDGYTHKVTLYATPSVGGYFNSSNFWLKEGEITKVYAYSRSGYRFESWMMGSTVVSTDNPLTIKMGTQDVSYKAVFTYNPESPTDPSANSFNAETGEVIIDNFVSGRLNSTLSNTVGNSDSRSAVKSIKVIGRLNSSDFGFAYSYTNCETIDLSRTTGYVEVPSYSFEDASSLKTVYLPANVENIGRYAFARCAALEGLYIYASIPPTLEEEVFNDVSENLIVYVPVGAVELYRNAEGWKELTIKPLDGDEYTFTVNFPSDAVMDEYKDMTLELMNVQSGQVYKYLVTDRRTYTFYALMKNTVYDVCLKNATGEVLADVQNVMLDEEDVSVSFDAIKKMHDVSLSVLTPEGDDVTAKVDITWYDEQGTYLRQGSSIKNIIAGNKLQYRIKINDELAMEYVQPATMETCVAGGNNIVHQLSRMEKVEISGRVIDAITKKEISNAAVSLSQTVNKTSNKTQVVRTDDNGCYSFTAYNAPCKLVVSAYDYVNQTNMIDTLAVLNGKAELPDVMLASIIGATINISHTYVESVEEGVTPEIVKWYNDYENIIYDVYNVSLRKQISQVSYRYPQLVLLDDAKVGDSLRITATSKKNAFMPVIVGATIDSTNFIDVRFDIKQLGQVKATYKSTENQSVVGILYGSNGQFISKHTYSEGEVKFKDLKDDIYYLVTMGENERYNSVYNISRFLSLGLQEDEDYVKKEVIVESGVISTVSFDDVPYFDENKFNYIEMGNSSLRAAQSSIIIGSYVTLIGKLDVIGDLEELTDLKFMIDIPTTAMFVERSVMIGDTVSSDYTYENNTLIIPLKDYRKGDKIKFCIVPTEAGDYVPGAFVSFYVDGRQTVLPMGNSFYSVEALEIKVPPVTVSETVMISGVVAKPNSVVEIYDNDVLVGSTRSVAKGQWSSKIDLYKPYSRSYHSIYAEITDPNGHVFKTTNKLLEFNKDGVDLKELSMIYGTHTIVFDQVERKNSSNSYSYVPGHDDFTFTAEFTNADSSLVKDVKFVVLASDGTTRTLEAEYNEGKHLWFAKSKYSNSAKIPVNVRVQYYHSKMMGMYDSIAIAEDSIAESKIYEEIAKNFTKENCTFIEASDKSLTFSYERNGGILYYKVELLKYSENISCLEDFKKYKSIYNNKEYYFADSIVNNNHLTYLWDIESDTLLRFTTSSTLQREIETYSRALKLPSWSSSGPIAGHIIDDVYLFTGAQQVINQYGGRYTDLGRWGICRMNTFRLFKEINRETRKMLNATCEDGTRKLSDLVYEWGEMYRGFYWSDVETMMSYFDFKLETYQRYIESERNSTIVANAISAGVGFGLNIITGGGSGVVTSASKGFLSGVAGWIKAHLSTFKQDVIGSAVQNNIINGFFNSMSMSNYYDNYAKGIDEWYTKESSEILNRYLALQKGLRWRYIKCPEDEQEDEQDDEHDNFDELDDFGEYDKGGDFGTDNNDFLSPSLTPTIDPAGYVYEGVSSNRIEGVMASCYYKETEEDEFGIIQDRAVLWNAEEYEQENPLFTDENGMYQWFVPQGLWQVKFEKEGYETTYSDWLPVPPPQLEVNIPMVQNVQPEVAKVHAYENGIVVEFDKYMLPATLNTENIFVLQNGGKISGSILMLNEEIAYRDSSVVYASKIRFVYDQPVTAKEITLTVANRVKSYAGIPMQETYTQTFDIEEELTSIVVDSLAEISIGSEALLSVTVHPASASAGKTLSVRSSSAMIASTDAESYILDENGRTTVRVYGELPGSAVLTYTMKDCDLVATTDVHISMLALNECAAPTTSVAPGPVEKGTEVYLSCKTEGATIYYTLDGSCPCSETEAVKVYDGTPIVITESVTIKAMAKAPELYESEVAEFKYTVSDGTGIDDVKADDGVQIYPLPMRDLLNVEVEGKSINYIQLSTMNGTKVVTSAPLRQKAQLDVSHLSAGVYIISIITDEGSVSRKVVKIE